MQEIATALPLKSKKKKQVHHSLALPRELYQSDCVLRSRFRCEDWKNNLSMESSTTQEPARDDKQQDRICSMHEAAAQNCQWH